HRSLIGQARSEGEQILAEARRVAESQRERVKEETEAERQRRLEDIKRQIEAETQRALGQIRAEVAELALVAAAKVAGKALDDVLGDADELLRNFLRLLSEKGRSGQIEEIHAELERLAAAEERRLEVELTTARELSDEEEREILEQIERASGRKVEATRRV